MEKKYTIGIDFGTLSGRAVLASAADGREVASAVMDYPHAVIDTVLPGTGERLPANWALEDPQDYLDVLKFVIGEVQRLGGVSAEEVAGIGIDFTCCTIIPVYADGTPLCLTEKFAGEKHAWCKLWKHHAAQPYADRINEIVKRRGDDWLVPFGNKMSSEWMYPKVWETLAEAPEVYEECDYYIEAADWLNWLLTGRQTRSYLFAAFKAQYRPGHGYPPVDFFTDCDPRLGNLVSEKMNAPVIPTGSVAGYVTEEAAKRFGLCPGTVVAAATPDAHVAAPTLGIKKPGDMFGIFGTSNCYFAVCDKFHDIPGICGCVEDGLLPGYYGCEAGLCCVGDHFAWLADNFTPAAYLEEAKDLGISPLKLLIRKAAAKKPGETGLVALDWWNGNRNVLVNGELSGLIVGMTLHTKPEDIMRALIEATAFGTRVIMDTYTRYGVKIDNFVAAGGIARKDPFTMQLYADVLHRPVTVSSSAQAPAAGCTIMAAAAAGLYPTLTEAVEHMQSPADTVYYPDPEAGRIYDRLYDEYVRLHDFFGRGGNDVMMRLRRIAAGAAGTKN